MSSLTKDQIVGENFVDSKSNLNIVLMGEKQICVK